MTLTEPATYDPAAHLATDYPTWWIATADLGPNGPDHVVSTAKIVIVDPAKFGDDRELALAHVAYHLDEHMHRLADLTDDECEQADLVAQIRLDKFHAA